MEIIEDVFIIFFYKFYHRGLDKVNMLRYKATSNFESLDNKRYARIFQYNPIYLW